MPSAAKTPTRPSDADGALVSPFARTLRRKFVIKTAPWAAFALTAVMAAPAAAQQQPNGSAPELSHVRALIQQAMQQAQPQAPAGTPFTTPGPKVDLSIDEALQRGMDKNIDIAVAK